MIEKHDLSFSAEIFNPKSLDNVSHLRDFALNAEKVKLVNQPENIQLSILLYRAIFSEEDLRNLSNFEIMTRAFLKYNSSKGKINFRNIIISEHKATAEKWINNQKAVGKTCFLKSDNKWYVDIERSNAESLNEYFEIMEKRGYSKNDAFVAVLKFFSERNSIAELWVPINKKSRLQN